MSPEERSALIEDIKLALTAVPMHQLTAEEYQWVQLAIKAQAERAELRRAIIEKSLGSLVWLAITGLGYMVWEFLANHGLRL